MRPQSSRPDAPSTTASTALTYPPSSSKSLYASNINRYYYYYYFYLPSLPFKYYHAHTQRRETLAKLLTKRVVHPQQSLATHAKAVSYHLRFGFASTVVVFAFALRYHAPAHVSLTVLPLYTWEGQAAVSAWNEEDLHAGGTAWGSFCAALRRRRQDSACVCAGSE